MDMVRFTINLDYVDDNSEPIPGATLMYDRIITLLIKKHRPMGAEEFKEINIFVPAGTGNIFVYDYEPREFNMQYDIIGVFPHTFSEVSGYKGLTIDGDFIPTESGLYNLGAGEFKWKDIYAENGTIITSDKNAKKDIVYDISKYEQLFDKLKPASYKYRDGVSGRTHLGFISQDIRDILEEIGMTSQEFAMYICSIKEKSKLKPIGELTEDDYIYALRYDELHAMEVNEIQKLKKEIELLKQTINKEE